MPQNSAGELGQLNVSEKSLVSNSTQHNEINKLLENLLSMKIDEFDVYECMKLILGISKGVICPILAHKQTSLSEDLTAQVIMCLKAIIRLINFRPNVLYCEIGEQNTPYLYEFVIPNVISLFQYRLEIIDQLLDTCLTSILSSSGSNTALYKSTFSLHAYYFQILNKLAEFSRTEVITDPSIFPPELNFFQIKDDSLPLKISVRLLLIFFTALDSSSIFLEMTTPSTFAFLFDLTSNAFNTFKFKAAELSFNMDKIHFFFSQIFHVAFKVNSSSRSSWCNLTLQWLCLIRQLSVKSSISSELDMKATSLAIELIELIVTNQTGGVLSSIIQIDYKSSKKGNVSKQTNISKALNIISGLLNSKELGPYDANFVSSLGFTDPILFKKVQALQNVTQRATFTLSSCTPGFQSNGNLFSKIFDDLPFSNKRIEGPDELKLFIINNFTSLSLKDKVYLISRVGLSACFMVGTLDVSNMRCKNCDCGIISVSRDRPFLPVYESIFNVIIKLPGFFDSPVLRLETLKAFRRVVSGMDVSFNPKNDLGSWISSSLRSTNRDIRIAASMILPFFASNSKSSTRVIDVLSKININSEKYLIETTIMAWAQLAKNAESDTLNIILVKLIDFFALPSTFSTSLVMYYIRSIARYKNLSTWNLFSPFWKTISLSVIKQKYSTPIVLSRFCRLLDIPVDEFLSRTHSYTVPYLIWNGDKESIESIASSLKYHVEQLIVSDLKNIISVSFLNEIKYDEKASKFGELSRAKLINICDTFQRLDFMGTITSDCLEISVEVLKRYHSNNLNDTMSDEEAKKKTINDLSQIFSFICVAKVRKAKKNATLRSNMSEFLDENILGILHFLTGAILNPSEKTSHIEQLECLNGLANLIICSGNIFFKAIPQICSLLQAALEISVLQAETIKVWALVFRSIKTSDLEQLTDLIFSVVIQKWDFFTKEAQKSAKDLLNYLVFVEKDEMKHIIQTKGVPHTYGMLPDLADIHQQITTMVIPPQLNIHQLNPLLKRIFNENVYVVRQTILEIKQFLMRNQPCISEAMNIPILRKNYIDRLYRVLLNTSYQFHDSKTDIPYLCSQCLGIIGAADPSKIDITVENRSVIVTHNFNDAKESISFVVYFLENYLVKAFRASTDPNAQVYLAYGIQEYLKFCGLYYNSNDGGRLNELWDYFSPSSQSLMLPMRTSCYTLTASPAQEPETYPIFHNGIDHFKWIERFTIDLLQKAKTNINSEQIFKVFRKFITYLDTSVYNFILPYVALNVVLGESAEQRKNIVKELLLILSTSNDNNKNSNMKRFYSSVFSVIDYFNKWKRHRQQFLGKNSGRSKSSRSGNIVLNDKPIGIIDSLMSNISPSLMAQRSYECESYPRAIMYWEQFLDKNPNADSVVREDIYSKFMEIYANINDPDSLEGAARSFKELSVPRKILQMENTGRWDDALECYESLSKSPEWEWDSEPGYHMFRCMKQGGNYDNLLSLLDSMMLTQEAIPEKLLSVGIETSWLAGDFKKMETLLSQVQHDSKIDFSFEVNIARALICLQRSDFQEFRNRIEMARWGVSENLASSPVSSLYQCHESLVRLHGLADLELVGDLSSCFSQGGVDHRTMSTGFNRRLDLVGSNYEAKCYLLALRRSAVLSTNLPYAKEEAQITWIYSSRFARKLDQYKLALRASLNGLSNNQFTNYEAYIEYAKLFCSQDDYYEAIKCLDSMVPGGLIQYLSKKDNEASNSQSRKDNDGAVIDRYLAKSALLQTKWLDMSGEGKSSEIMQRYALVARVYPQWEKSHYYSAKYYNRIYDSQLAQSPENRSKDFYSGDYISLMVRNYAMALPYGIKYVYETLPKMISLWLDFADNINKFEDTPPYSKEVIPEISFNRKENLAKINDFLLKFVERVPAFVFYMAMPQLMSRIGISESKASIVLHKIIINTVKAYPRQALWYVFGKANSQNNIRNTEIGKIIDALRSKTPVPATSQIQAESLSTLLISGQKFVNVLTQFAYVKVSKMPASNTLKLKDFKFDMSSIPCGLVVPVQQCMRAVLPNVPEGMKHHNPFPKSSVITIANIDDTVNIMQSLQKPKKITIFGSNGKRYRLLCKSHDDVRKDSRLMDLTFAIDSLLQRNDKAFKRRLYIKTYFVTPLAEDSGLIEWVDGMRPLRDILTAEHSSRGTAINWKFIKENLENKGGIKDLVQGLRRIIQMYPSVLRYWFLEVFPEPSAWLEGRGRYGRSLAVMSMVGYILGVGDRHGENILFDVNTGGIMHVDFDCLFDKGKDLEMPELVPFRMTHNMVDALGVFGCEGIFRKSCEVTLELIRVHEGMVMTMLDVFFHDPILDWSKKRRQTKKKHIKGFGAARSPEEALWSIQNRIRGKLQEEVMPLKVPGQVSYLIAEATDEQNLAQMYIGWMAYF